MRPPSSCTQRRRPARGSASAGACGAIASRARSASTRASGRSSCAAKTSTPQPSAGAWAPRPKVETLAWRSGASSARSHSQSSGARCAGSQPSAARCQGSAQRSMRAAACLSSGWRDSGSSAREVSALTPALPGSQRAPKCIGIAAVRSATDSVRRTGSSSAPRAVSTRTSSPSPAPIEAAVAAESSTAGGSTASAVTSPLREAPCHWSRSRVVVSATGQSPPVASAVVASSIGTKRARPSAVAKRRSR